MLSGNPGYSGEPVIRGEMKMNGILVLGASGYAGHTIFNHLRKDRLVHGTYHSQKDRFENYAEMYDLDIGDLNGLESMLRRLQPRIIISSLRGDFEKQKLLHRKAAEYIAGRPGGKLIYLSTANVFDNRLSAPHYESDQTDAESDYGKFKISCENMLQGMLREKGIILRVPEIWGKGCPRLKKLTADSKNNNRIFTWGNLYVNYTLDVQIAQYIQYIIDNDLTGIFHIGSKDLYNYAQFQKDLAEKLHLKAPDFEITTLPQREYQAVLTSRNDIPENLCFTVNDILEYLTN